MRCPSVHTGEPEGQQYVVLGGGSGPGYLGSLTRHVFETIAVHAHVALHVRVLAGREPHHIVDAQFKALARAFRDAVPDWSESDVRTLLAKFGLTGEHVPRPAASLSPGERTRAALALLQAREVNLLVLDEPTNHLDLPAIEQLE